MLKTAKYLKKADSPVRDGKELSKKYPTWKDKIAYAKSRDGFFKPYRVGAGYAMVLDYNHTKLDTISTVPCIIYAFKQAMISMKKDYKKAFIENNIKDGVDIYKELCQLPRSWNDTSLKKLINDLRTIKYSSLISYLLR